MSLIPRFVLHILLLFCYFPIVFTSGTRLHLAEKHYNKAADAYKRNQLAEALREYQITMFYGGESAELLNNTGAVLLSMDKSDEALKWFIKAKQKDPGLLAVRVNLGIAFYELRRWEDLLRESNSVLAMGTEDGWVFFGHGVALYHLGKYNKARENLKISLTKQRPSSNNDYAGEARRLLRKIKLLTKETGRF